MPTIYELALICQDVYLRDSIPKSPKLALWERENQPLAKEILSKEIRELFKEERQGFFARLYLQIFTKQPVIAFRGTLLTKIHNLEGDYQIWLNELPQQFHPAFIYYQHITQFLFKNNIILKPILTGHSLGGVLANLIAIKMHLTSVAFNAPGIGDFPKISKNLPYPNIYNIDYQSDPIHKIGRPIGNIQIFDAYHMRYLSLSQLALYDALQFINIPLLNKIYNLAESHSIDTLVSALEFDSLLKKEEIAT